MQGKNNVEIMLFAFSIANSKPIPPRSLISGLSVRFGCDSSREVDPVDPVDTVRTEEYSDPVASADPVSRMHYSIQPLILNKCFYSQVFHLFLTF